MIERNFLGLDRIEQRVAILRRACAGTLRVGCTPALALSAASRITEAFDAIFHAQLKKLPKD